MKYKSKKSGDKKGRSKSKKKSQSKSKKKTKINRYKSNIGDKKGKFKSKKKKSKSKSKKKTKKVKKSPKKSSACKDQTWRSFDGTCNNIHDYQRGSSGQFYFRGEEGFQPGRSAIGPYDFLHPRTISNALGSQNNPPIIDENQMTMMTVLFGQFVNHDLEKNAVHNEFVREFDEIPIDPNDPLCFLSVGRPKGPPLATSRCDDSSHLEIRPSKGSMVDDVFQVINEATSYLDLYAVYGRDETIANILREGEGGRLKADTYNGVAFGSVPYYFENLPPSIKMTGLPKFTLLWEQPDDQIPSAGDRRISDNVSVFLFHTLFLREHNRLAAEIAETDPGMSDESIFQNARSINIAQYYEMRIN